MRSIRNLSESHSCIRIFKLFLTDYNIKFSYAVRCRGSITNVRDSGKGTTCKRDGIGSVQAVFTVPPLEIGLTEPFF
jgi:hypothetical protein